MPEYFGTDGIRGRYGEAWMHPQFARRLGSALALYLARNDAATPRRIVIGRDNRSSGPALCASLIQGLDQ